ncbi:MAG: MBL fold metallo-hydrolase [Methyloligellaceae bacterium]
MTKKRTTINRRTMLLSTAGLLAAPAILSSNTQTVQAAAAKLGAAHPTHYRFKLGEFEVTTIWDGAIKLKGPHPIFGQNVEEKEVQDLAAVNFLPKTEMEISFTPVIVNTGKEIIVFDSGNGNARRAKGAGKLKDTLAVAGFKPEQVDIVVITHCHPDHIGGLMEGNNPLFPNARYVMGETEYNFWSPKEVAEGKLARVGKIVQSNVVPLAPKMTFLKNEGTVVPGITAIGAEGHTPGHMAYHLESGNSRLLLWADTTNHYVASLQRPDWHVRFDMDKEKAAATRKRILDMVAADKIPASGYHMPFPAVGFVEKRGASYRWVPTAYQLNL